MGALRGHALLGVRAPVSAQDERAPQNLSVLGAVHYALAHAPILLAQEYDIASAVSTFVAKQAAEYPSIAGQLQNEITKSSNLNGAFAAYGITPVNNFSQNTAQVISQYNLYNGASQIAAQQAKRYVQNASGQFQAQEETTVLGVSTDYYNLVALHRALGLDERRPRVPARAARRGSRARTRRPDRRRRRAARRGRRFAQRGDARPGTGRRRATLATRLQSKSARRRTRPSHCRPTFRSRRCRTPRPRRWSRSRRSTGRKSPPRKRRWKPRA